MVDRYRVPSFLSSIEFEYNMRTTGVLTVEPASVDHSRSTKVARARAVCQEIEEERAHLLHHSLSAKHLLVNSRLTRSWQNTSYGFHCLPRRSGKARKIRAYISYFRRLIIRLTHGCCGSISNSADCVKAKLQRSTSHVTCTVSCSTR